MKFRCDNIKTVLTVPTIIATMLLIILIMLYTNERSAVSVINEPGGLTVGGIRDGVDIRQSFVSPCNGLNGFSIMFATYARNNAGNVTVQLYDKTDNYKMIYAESFLASQLLDNTYRDFQIDVQPDSENHQYEIVVSSDADIENSITIWGNSNDSYAEGEAFTNDLPLDMDISFIVRYSRSVHGKDINLIVFILICLIFICHIFFKMGIDKFKRKRLAAAADCFVSSLFMTLAMGILYSFYIQDRNGLRDILGLDSFIRMALLFPISVFINCHVVVPIAKLYDYVFRNRWLIVLGVFVFLMLFKINLSNSSMFDFYIQPGMGTEFNQPLFGRARPIRSDEWLVSTPWKISASYSNYGRYNNILRGALNHNISATGLFKGYSALSNLFNFGYYLFGTEYGMSWQWIGMFLMSFMLSFELSLILSKGNRLIALLGGCLISLSSFSLWWSIMSYIISFQGVIVCAYYFFAVKTYRKKCILALGVALSGAYYICALYPAWQVPMAYLLIAFIVWLAVDNFSKIKKFNKTDWGIITAAFAFMVSVVLVYLYDNREYSEAVLNTVYPGKRFGQGGWSLSKLSYYIQSLLYPVRDIGNNSEAGVFFNLFPIPMLWGFYIFVRQLIDKRKDNSSKIDILNATMLIPTLFLTIYCTVGFPDWLAKCSLMSYSVEQRAVDILGLVNIYFIIRLINNDFKKYKLPFWIGAILLIANISVNINSCLKSFGQYMDYIYLGIIAIIVFGFGIILLCQLPDEIRKVAVGAVITIVGLSGLTVLPLARGVDSVLKKPASYAIQQIVNEHPDAKWIGYDFISAQFVVANGGPCISSVNYIPNMKLWEALDPVGKYNEIYNRYSHISVSFTSEPTSFSLIAPDHIQLSLSFEDIEKTETKYIFSLTPIYEETDIVDFELLYQEGNVYIYEIIYL